eukprot:2642513-Amphidinium_carterae.1
MPWQGIGLEHDGDMDDEAPSYFGRVLAMIDSHYRPTHMKTHPAFLVAAFTNESMLAHLGAI